MSIASRIQAIEQHLTDDYNVLEVAGADLTNVNKNILNLKTTWQERLLYFINNGTDVVWNNWDKVTGEGTTLTLNNTEEAPMKINLKGNTSQATTTGKNICEISNFSSTTQLGITFTNNGDGSISVSGTATGLCVFRFSKPMSLTNGTTYYINGGYSENISINFRDSGNMQYGTSSTGATSEGNFTPSSNMSNMYLAIRISSGTSANVKLYPMLALTSGGEYEPYTNGASPNPDYPQDIHVVSGDNEIVVCGKNLLDESSLELGSINSNTGQNEPKENEFRTNSYIKVDSSTNYTLSNQNYTDYTYRGIFEYDENHNYIKRTNNTTASTTTPFTLETSSTTKYVRIRYIVGHTISSVPTNMKLQYEKGSSASSYEPYQGNTYPVNLGVENLFELPATQTINGITFTNNGNGTFNLSGTASAITDFAISKELSTIANGNYTMSSKSTGYSLMLAFYNGNSWLSTPINKLTTGLIKTGNITIPSNATRYDLVIRVSSGSTINLINETVQFEKGSKANSFTPYGTTPIELCKIGDYQDSIKKSTGKNLINFNNLVDVTLKGVTTSYLGSKFKMNGTTDGAGNTIALGNNLNITIPAGTYTLTFAVESGSNTGVGSGKDTAFYFSKTNSSSSADWLASITIGQLNTNNKYSVTFTTNEATPLYLYAYTNNSGMTFNNYVVQVQLEKGTQDTSFEPYGTGWYVKKEIGKVVLDGSENWGVGQYGTNSYNLILNDFLHKTETTSILSNLFKGVSYNDRTTGDNIVYTDVNEGKIYVRNTSYTSLADFKTMLGLTNMIAYYILATPTYTEITDSTLISQLNALAKSYTSQTNISQESNDLPFIINATALREME